MHQSSFPSSKVAGGISNSLHFPCRGSSLCSLFQLTFTQQEPLSSIQSTHLYKLAKAGKSGHGLHPQHSARRCLCLTNCFQSYLGTILTGVDSCSAMHGCPSLIHCCVVLFYGGGEMAASTPSPPLCLSRLPFEPDPDHYFGGKQMDRIVVNLAVTLWNENGS